MVGILILFSISFSIGLIMYGYFVLQDLRGQVNISNTAWHVRLLEHLYQVKFTSFTGICNYAWAVFGTLAFLPVIYLAITIFHCALRIAGIYNNMKEYYHDYCELKKATFHNELISGLEDVLVFNTTTSPLLDKWVNALIRYNSYDYGYTPTKEGEILHELEQGLSPTAMAYLARRVAIWEEEQRVEKAAFKAKKECSKFSTRNVNIIASRFKVIFKMLGIIGIAWGISLIYRLMVFISQYLNTVDWAYTFQVWIEWAIIMLQAIVGGSCAILAYFIVYCIWKYAICRLFNYCATCEMRKDTIKNFFRGVWQIISFPFSIIGAGVYYIYAVLYAYKEANCTAINWVNNAD